MSQLLSIRRASLRALTRRLPQVPVAIIVASRRPFATKPPPGPYPSPPRLPPEEQAEFERLQNQAMEKLSSTPPPTEQASPSGSRPNAKDPFFKKAEPEFEGDVNPKTGEAGGPKNEPLKWGGRGDWSYNGKVTDF